MTTNTKETVEDKYVVLAKELVELGVKYDRDFDRKMLKGAKGPDDLIQILRAFCIERLPNARCWDRDEVSRIYGVLHVANQENRDSSIITDSLIIAKDKLVEEGLRLLESSFAVVKEEFERHEDKLGLMQLVDGLMSMKRDNSSNSGYYPFVQLAYPIARQLERTEGTYHRIDDIRKRLLVHMKEAVDESYDGIIKKVASLYNEHEDKIGCTEAAKMMWDLKKPEYAYKFYKAMNDEAGVQASIKMVKDTKSPALYQAFLKEQKEKDPECINEIVAKKPQLEEFRDVLEQFV